LLADEARLQALAAADLFVLPAVGEGFSMAVLEALASGVPVVVSPECHFPEVAPAGAGLVVEPAVAPLRDALRALLTDPERRATMGQHARELVRRHYTWSRVVAQLDEVYAGVVRPPRSPRSAS
jgi:glycosyltransferase involved in cell wall biosynthesis